MEKQWCSKQARYPETHQINSSTHFLKLKNRRCTKNSLLPVGPAAEASTAQTLHDYFHLRLQLSKRAILML